MNKEKQRRQILRFLRGKGNRDIDAFCIYQWIERCHFEGWWNLALELANSIPPNSLNKDYHKRLNYLLSECRYKRKNIYDGSTISKKIHMGDTTTPPSGKYHLIKDLMFENSSKETLRQIYSVLFHMKYYNAEFSDAIRATMKILNINDLSLIHISEPTRPY